MAAAAITLEGAVDRYAARFPRAIARALNRAGTSTRAVMARGISKDVGLPVNVVREQIKVERATPASLTVRLSVTGKRIPLINFNARGPEPSRGRGRGVSYRLPGGAGRIREAFIARVGTQRHRGVFIRRIPSERRSRGAWGKNLPIKQLFGPSLPKVFVKLRPEGLAHGRASFLTNLRSELRFAGATLTD